MINVGEKLKEERKKKGLTIDEVAKATKIRANFLESIEEGQYEKLPGASYAHGFVKNYLEFLDLPVGPYLARFRREYDEEKQRKLMPEGLVGKDGIPLRKFSIQQAMWLGGVIIIFLLSYLLFQYRAAIWSPLLSIDTPKDNATITTQIVVVAGTTDSNVAVTVDGLPAYVDANGKFLKQLPVFPGNVTITIKAVNSFGKISSVVRHILVKTQ